MKILGVIPARYESSRFPGKVLAQIGDKSMVQRVYNQACQSQLLDDVVIATESTVVQKHVEEFGGNCCLTGNHHVSGTDRCFEALTLQNQAYDYVVNIQGDEPFLAPAQIDEVAKLLDGKVELATLVKRIEQAEELFNVGEVKTVFNNKMEALYFSRQPIPFLRNHPERDWLSEQSYYKHIGIYAYRADVLDQIAQMPPSPLELAESLEQLRWLENGLKIQLAFTNYESVCIDTQEDLDRVMLNLSQYEG
jgi:3-deoxy-manno-octulosonate cytidylyltransferase (CMP-KDO synthetase)